MKNKLIGGELTYRITAGPNGTKIVHLYNTPGGKFDFGSIQQHNYHLWYWYYETTDNRDECLEANKDIVKLPSDVQTEILSWTKLNKPAQNWVRRYLMTYAKEGLARIWGKFSGELQVPDSTVKLDYSTLQTEYKDERTKLIEELIGADGMLTRLRPEKLMERRKLEAEYLNAAMKFRAMPIPIQAI